MKQIFILIAVTGLIILSCKKNNQVDCVPKSLDGKWRMIIVRENISGLTITKPSSINGDVDITFTSSSLSNGTFAGNTPTNDIGQTDYSTGPNQTITIPGLNMTKVMETSWGEEFVGNIRNAERYSFEIDGILNIKTTNKTLTLKNYNGGQQIKSEIPAGI